MMKLEINSIAFDSPISGDMQTIGAVSDCDSNIKYCDIGLSQFKIALINFLKNEDIDDTIKKKTIQDIEGCTYPCDICRLLLSVSVGNKKLIDIFIYKN